MNKILLIGKGYWGKNWYNTLLKTKRSFVVVDKTLPTGLDSNGIENYTDLSQVNPLFFTHAIISTNAESHLTLFQELSRTISKSQILIEKPCGSNWTDSDKLSDCFPGYLQLYSPAFKYIRNNIGQIGIPHLYKSIRASMGPRIRNYESIVEDYLIHDLYLFISLFQPSNDIQIINRTFIKRLPNSLNKDTIFLTVYNPEIHVFGDMFSSWWYPIKERRVIISGDKGSFIWINDDLYYNSSRYEKIQGIDEYGNLGNKLIHSVDEKIELGTESALECELDHFLRGNFMDSCSHINTVWNLIRDITLHTKYRF